MKFSVGDHVKVNYQGWASERCGIVAVHKHTIDLEIVKHHPHIYRKMDPAYLQLELIKSISHCVMEQAAAEYEDIMRAEECLSSTG